MLGRMPRGLTAEIRNPICRQYQRTLWEFGGVELYTRPRASAQYQFIPQAAQFCRDDGAVQRLEHYSDFSGQAGGRESIASAPAACAEQLAAMAVKQGHVHSSDSRRERRAA